MTELASLRWQAVLPLQGGAGCRLYIPVLCLIGL